MRIPDGGWLDWPGVPGADSVRVRVRRTDDGRLVIAELHIVAERLTADVLRHISLARIEAALNAPGRGVASLTVDRAPLTRPDGTDPESFYRRVARAYLEYAADSRAPAKRIAEESGAPVGSVHRWIAEARQRGFLPPGQKGRAG